jgi:broad specificity phosphatase PhoE
MTGGELWLVRHGETEWSATGRHTGLTDIDLTDDGRRHAMALRKRLAGREFVRVLTSPALRARVTCELAGFGDRAEVVEDLHEWDYGQDEGLTSEQIRRDVPGWTVWDPGPRGGETAAQISERADRVIAMARGEQGAVLAFAHGHISRVIGARWIGLEAVDGARLALSTAAVCVLGYERDVPAIDRWNDTGHLEE